MNELAGKTEKIDWNNCNPNTTQTTRKRPFLKRMGSLGGMVLTSMSDRRKKFLWKAQSWKNRFSCTSSGDGVVKRVLFGEIMKASSKVYTESGRQTELFHDLSGSRCAMRGKLKEDSSQPSLAPPSPATSTLVQTLLNHLQCLCFPHPLLVIPQKSAGNSLQSIPKITSSSPLPPRPP